MQKTTFTPTDPDRLPFRGMACAWVVALLYADWSHRKESTEVGDLEARLTDMRQVDATKAAEWATMALRDLTDAGLVETRGTQVTRTRAGTSFFLMLSQTIPKHVELRSHGGETKLGAALPLVELVGLVVGARCCFLTVDGLVDDERKIAGARLVWQRWVVQTLRTHSIESYRWRQQEAEVAAARSAAPRRGLGRAFAPRDGLTPAPVAPEGSGGRGEGVARSGEGTGLQSASHTWDGGDRTHPPS